MALTGITRTIRVFQILHKSKIPFNFLTENCGNNGAFSVLFNSILFRHVHSRKKPEDPDKIPERNAPLRPKERKPMTSPEIMLINPENQVSTVTLEQAEKMASRRKLKLVKIVDFDTKTKKPVYKIMSALQYIEAELENKSKKRKEKETSLKEEKLFIVSSKITEHDLHFKMRQMSKLLQKKHLIRVYVSQDGNPQKMEETASAIEKELAEIVNSKKRVAAANTLKLFFTPKIGSEKNSEIEKEKTIAPLEGNKLNNNSEG